MSCNIAVEMWTFASNPFQGYGILKGTPLY